MNTVKTVRELRAVIARARREGKQIALVPTMGNLHSGHAALVTTAAQQADFVVAVLRCWCADLCKVKEVMDFSDWLGMKFFMCANYEEDPAIAISEYDKPPVCF